jgi:signal peptidase II
MRFTGFASISAAVLLLDQTTKLLVVRHLPLGETWPLLPVLSLTHVQNTGAAFGFMQNSNPFFVASTLLILGFLAWSHKQLSAERGAALGLALLWGGALGNLLDRLRLGRVTDFLDFHWRHWHWYTFNVADSAISIAIALILTGNLLRPVKK